MSLQFAFLITARSLRSLSSSLCLCGEQNAKAITPIKDERQS
jgi:hypothetical protein